MTERELLSTITRKYLDSPDFNGLPTRGLHRARLLGLVRKGLVNLNFGDVHLNPHILAVPSHAPDIQLQMAAAGGLVSACAYPSKQHLTRVAPRGRYSDAPFSKRLLLGEPQLDQHYFDPSVLERYRNDPRYRLFTDEIRGSLGVNSLADEQSLLPARDRASIQFFGFAYDAALNRLLAVSLRYLHDLSPSQQRIWDGHRRDEAVFLHPDYHRNLIGQFGKRRTLLSAILEEIRVINDMCRRLKKPPLFRQDFRVRRPPAVYGFMLRPTKRALEDFVHTLDKVISENLNREFFKAWKSYSPTARNQDGTMPGTLQLLEQWIEAHFTIPDAGPKNAMLASFRRVRKQRQKPAHALTEDEFDLTLFQRQRALIKDSYRGVRTLRLLLANHPRLRRFKVPDWLQDGKFWER